MSILILFKKESICFYYLIYYIHTNITFTYVTNNNNMDGSCITISDCFRSYQCMAFVRFHRPTKYRGASAQNMKEEFSAYGLPAWSLYVVGFLKIMIAVSMIVTVLMPEFMFLVGVPALGILVVLMCGAIAMHVKVRDSFIKTLPALLMLAMSLVIYI